MIGISVDRGSREKVRRFVEGEKLTFAIAHDPEGRVQQLYNVAVVPETYLLSKDGRLLWQLKGGPHGATDKARTAIEQALRSEARSSVALR